jgi:hypothetical protein
VSNLEAFIDVLNSLPEDPDFKPKAEVVSALLCTVAIPGSRKELMRLLSAFEHAVILNWHEQPLPEWMIGTYAHLRDLWHAGKDRLMRTQNIVKLFPVR